jgi:periplasmic protein TonB
MYRVLTPADRARAWLGTAAATGLIGWLIVSGLVVGPGRPAGRPLDVFSLAPSPPPPRERVVPKRIASRRPAGKAAPPNLRATPKEIVAPPPVLPPLLPPPIVAPPIAATGPDASSGATDRPGPGTGAGGIGNGRGAGGDGNGDGSGYGPETPPRRIRDRISMRDYPAELMEAGISTSLSLRYIVLPNGRVAGCRVTESSGYPAVDSLSCREVERVYRYRPWRDGEGRAVSSVVHHDLDWIVDREPD